MTKTKTGFTLIEVLIVVALLGILASIAIPAFTNHITKARRADAQVALLEAAQKMERFFTNNNTYVGATIGDGANDLIHETSERGYYLLSFPERPDNEDNPWARGFIVRADAQNEQAGDSDCQFFTIDHLGRRSSGPSSNCW
ncbi:type IV pilin protein [Desulfonatronovibrio magnus]|uniref:type IV pilin protein n=1 Tax=Desulfonatronovibrio magnus TaxID=698827 RepID=UPI0005EBD957|nr:type IV pilin protein [Desulfonatronovibrio magnus]